MKQLVYFIAVGLAFTALQVASVEAQDPNCTGPNCSTADHSGMTGGPNDHRGFGDPGCDPNLAPDAGGCPDGFQGKPGGPPHHEGEHHDGPPIDPRSGQPFTKTDEDKYQKYADECDATNGLLSEGSAQELIADGFTRIQVDKLCKESAHDGPPPGAMCTNPAGGPMIPCPAP